MKLLSVNSFLYNEILLNGPIQKVAGKNVRQRNDGRLWQTYKQPAGLEMSTYNVTCDNKHIFRTDERDI